ATPETHGRSSCLPISGRPRGWTGWRRETNDGRLGQPLRHVRVEGVQSGEVVAGGAALAAPPDGPPGAPPHPRPRPRAARSRQTPSTGVGIRAQSHPRHGLRPATGAGRLAAQAEGRADAGAVALEVRRFGMPEMSGAELAARLRALSGLGGLRLLALTGLNP